VDGWLITPPTPLPLGRALVSTVKEAGWAPRLLWKGMEKRKSHAVTGVQTWTFQHIARCYMDCHIPAPTLLLHWLNC